MVYHLHQHSIGYLGDSFTGQKTQPTILDWIGLSSVLRPRQHSISYQSTEGKEATKVKSTRKRKHHKIQQYNKQTHIQSPSLQ